MRKKLSPAYAAALFTNYLNSAGGENQKTEIVLAFQPFIKYAAARYKSPPWYLDLMQEGNEGLLHAIHKFPPLDNRNKFLGYAIKAIKHAMADFARKTLKSKSFALFTSTYSTDPAQTADSWGDGLAPFDYYVTSSWPGEITYQLDRQNPRRIGLTDREIRIWDLYVKGYKHLEIAQIIHLSSSTTSKLIGEIRAKIRRLYK